ncbi:MAG: hypothetical protein ACD_76C00147G0004 [uncultured bacterium]|nr:MAG: hypothetical protein ACD_76C00147G0004 [uncultured bacterium]HBD05435.1 hypothetical protein [Candidatus Uhrbacteria bacterium]
MSRYFLKDALYFITVPTVYHNDYFKLPGEKAIVLNRLINAIKRFGIEQMDYSIMSNHYHLLAYFDDANVIPKMLQYISGGSSFEHNRYREFKNTIWDEYHVYVASTDNIYDRIRGYVIGNPYKHGDIKTIEELTTYQFSSFRNVAQKEGKEYAIDLVSSVIGITEEEFNKLYLKKVVATRLKSV